jgi:uncharacterized Zn-finger protein
MNFRMSQCQEMKCSKCPYASKSTIAIMQHLQQHQLAQLPKIIICANVPELTNSSARKDCGFVANFRQIRVKERLPEIKGGCNTPQEKNSPSKNVISKEIGWFKSGSEVEIGEKTEKSYDQRGDPEEEWFRCVRCSYRTKFIEFLEFHESTKHAPKIFSCEICSFKARNKGGLRSHTLYRHTVQKECFQCEICSFKTTWKSSLMKHGKSHGPKPNVEWFQCDRCTYRSKLKLALAVHKKRHEDVVMFQCEICDYKTKWKGNLKQHRKSRHESKGGAKWFRCNRCPFKFEFKDVLMAHKKEHEENMKWFECDQCQYKTLYKRCLKRHNVKHIPAEESTWFQCGLCFFKTKWKHILGRHMKNKHGNENEWFQCEHCRFRAKRTRTVEKHVVKKHAAILNR